MSAFPYNLLVQKPTAGFEPVGKWHHVYATRREAIKAMKNCVAKGYTDYLFSIWSNEDETRLNPEVFNERRYNDSKRWKEKKWLGV